MDKLLQQKLNDLKKKNLLRAPKGDWGDGFIDFTSNDYLGLSGHPEVIAAGVAAAELYGAGAGASRVAGGNHPLFAEFEAKIADYKGYEAATVFGSGYLANLGVITALEPEVVYADRLVHACIIDAVQLAGAKLRRYKHNDVNDLRRIIAKDMGALEVSPRGGFHNFDLQNYSMGPARWSTKNLIVSEEIFSMDGDLSPMEEMCGFGMPIIIDGAHSLYQESKVKSQMPEIYVGTMSKALGSYGGYVCGSRTLIDFLNTKARPLIYSTGLPPFAVGAAMRALEIIEREKLHLKVLENVDYLRSKIESQKSESAIVPIILGSEEKVLAAEKLLRENGILVSAIRPPTVPNGTSRLRISLTAMHRKSEIDLLAEKLKTIL